MKFLIVGPAWIGDMVMAQSLFGWLHRLHPGAEIHVAAPRWSAALAGRMAEVAGTIPIEIGHGEFGLVRRWRTGRQLRQARFDRAIVLPNSWKSALIPFFARIPRRTGWRGEMRHGLLNDLRQLDRARLPLMIDRFNALAFEPGRIDDADDFPDAHPRPRLIVDAINGASAMARLGLDEDRPVLALCPGAEYGPSKRWPPVHFARVAAERIAAGWQAWLFGSAADRPAAAAVLSALPPGALAHCHDLCGQTDLLEATDLIARARQVVTNDSGLMHIAAALDRPLVALFGSTSPEHTPPLSPRAATLRAGLSCSPCFERRCRFGHTRCMTELMPARVLDALAEMEARP